MILVAPAKDAAGMAYAVIQIGDAVAKLTTDKAAEMAKGINAAIHQAQTMDAPGREG